MNTMIVGGKLAKEYAWPWQVAMFEDGEVICGGSLIDPWWVMTAAHCVDLLSLCNPELYTFTVGSIDTTVDTDVSQERQASRIIVHPKYDFRDDYNYDNDIALFKMNGSFTLSEDFKVNTICLPTGDMEDQFVVGQNATVTGWGKLKSEEENYPDMLYEANVPIYNWTKCDRSLAGDDIFTDNMICAGYEKGGVDACKGDSGGPLVAYPSSNTDQYYQIGVVSWGNGCGEPNSPGVYTRVTRYEDWIRSFFNTPTQESYVPCACDDTKKMSSSTIAAISVLSVLLAIFICISVAFGISWYRQDK
eukprot:XP_011666423.1 PREDICTED: serine protease 52-like [Strongylocentrotus purpuratus]